MTPRAYPMAPPARLGPADNTHPPILHEHSARLHGSTGGLSATRLGELMVTEARKTKDLLAMMDEVGWEEMREH